MYGLHSCSQQKANEEHVSRGRCLHGTSQNAPSRRSAAQPATCRHLPCCKKLFLPAAAYLAIPKRTELQIHHYPSSALRSVEPPPWPVNLVKQASSKSATFTPALLLPACITASAVCRSSNQQSVGISVSLSKCGGLRPHNTNTSATASILHSPKHSLRTQRPRQCSSLLIATCATLPCSNPQIASEVAVVCERRQIVSKQESRRLPSHGRPGRGAGPAAAHSNRGCVYKGQACGLRDPSRGEWEVPGAA